MSGIWPWKKSVRKSLPMWIFLIEVFLVELSESWEAPRLIALRTPFYHAE